MDLDAIPLQSFESFSSFSLLPINMTLLDIKKSGGVIQSQWALLVRRVPTATQHGLAINVFTNF
jgi:hypothetical protein